MRSFCTSLVATLAVASCAHSNLQALTEAQIVEIAKRDSQQACRKNLMPQYEKAGCTYHAQLVDGHWSVIVHSDYRDKAGNRVAIHGSALYLYSIDGELIEQQPGM